MVRVAGPVLSLEASGSLGGVIVFSKWKGRPYVRTLVRPSNPKSGGQVGVRSLFKFISQKWAAISDADKATWENRADQAIVSPFNSYMGFNQARWRDFEPPATADPPTDTDTPATVGSITVTAGVRSATISIAITTAADGWGVLAFRSPDTGFSTAFDNLIGANKIEGTDAVVIVDTPLVAGTYYYNFREFTEDGQLSAEIGEETIVIV